MCRSCQKWMGVGDFFWKMVGVGYFLEKWVGASRFCQKMSGSVLFFLENGWEWVRVVGSDWE